MGFYHDDKFKKYSIVVMLLLITTITLYLFSHHNKKYYTNPNQLIDAKNSIKTRHNLNIIFPELIYPPNKQVFPSQDNQAEITFVGKHHEPLDLQISEDMHFTRIIKNTMSLIGDRTKLSLPPGTYFWRLRVQGNDNLWTAAKSFTINRSQLMLPTTTYQLRIRAFVPTPKSNNKIFRLENYLKQINFLKQMFSQVPRNTNSKIEIQDLESKKIYTLANNEWPRELLSVGSYAYRFRFVHEDYLPSRWSTPKRLYIILSPPKLNPVYTRKNILADYLEKISQKLAWQPTPFTKHYELQISRYKNFKTNTSLISKATKNYVGIFPNTQYYWRVRALDQNKQPLSRFSRSKELYISTQDTNIYIGLNETPLPPVPKPKKQRQPAATMPEKMRLPKKESQVVTEISDSKPLLQQLWAWLGTGLNSVTYDQSLNGDSSLNYSSASQTNYMVSAGLMTSTNLGAEITYKNSPSTIKDPDNNISSTKDYTWTTLSGDLLYRLPWAFNLFGHLTTTTLRFGAQQHEAPYLNLNTLDRLDLIKNELMLASIGFELERNAGAWRYSLMMRYQEPLSTKLEGATSFDLNSQLFFDSSLGVSYAFFNYYRLGFFMYGQWLKYNFSYTDTAISNFGTQDLFFSTMDLRFGFDF